VGDGSTFPNCIQHQVANLAGALNGTSGGTPVLWGAASEGPASAATSGTLSGMLLCPANGVDTFAIFNGNDGSYSSSKVAVYRDNVQSYSTTEPGIDLTSTSFLMWSWRMAGAPSPFARDDRCLDRLAASAALTAAARTVSGRGPPPTLLDLLESSR